MARTVVKLEEQEVVYFHMNYAYMWKKLNTAPYYVSGAGQMPKWIHDQWLLPSYANLSKCLNLAYIPSMNIVNKIVRFYNANIQPEVDTYAFLHEKLESTNSLRSTEAEANAGPYCGLYHCYYYSGLANRKQVYGAVMRIDRFHDEAVVQMITGLTDDETMNGVQLKNLIDQKDIAAEQYKAFRERLPLSRRRTGFFKGTVQLLPGIMTMEMQSVDHAGSFLVIRLPLTESTDEQYFGSLGLLTLLQDKTLHILKLGVVRSDVRGIRTFSLQDPQLGTVLSIEKLENEHVKL